MLQRFLVAILVSLISTVVAAQEEGRLMIETTPSGATISIDGDQVGSSPTSSGNLSGGNHTVEALFPDGQKITQTVTVNGTRLIHIDEAKRGREKRPAAVAPLPPVPAPPPTNGFSRPTRGGDCRDERVCASACDKGDGFACARLGTFYAVGKGVPKDPIRALSLFEKSCSANAATGCVQLGRMYEEGKGIPQDVAHASSVYEKLCAGGDAEGCGRLGSLTAAGKGTQQNDARAAELLSRACAWHYAAACRDLGVMTENGRAGAADTIRAGVLYQQACDGGDAAGCAQLGRLYAAGKGVTADRKRAAALYDKACSGADAGACRALAEMYLATNAAADLQTANTYLKRACDAGHADSCHRLGLAYEAGRGTAADPAAALEYFRRACESHVVDGCYRQAQLISRGTQPADAVPLYSKACQLGSAAACGALGVIYQDGKLAAADVGRAAQLHQTACDGGVVESCTRLAALIESGKAATRGKDQLATLYGKACDAGDAASCTKLAGLQGGAANDAKTIALYERGCTNGDARACLRLGLIDERAQDPGRAAPFYTKACQASVAEACGRLGALQSTGHVVKPDADAAQANERKACDGGWVEGCRRLALLLDAAPASDDATVIDLLTKACDGNDAEGCRELAVRYQSGHRVTRNLTKADGLFEKACTGGNGQACVDRAASAAGSGDAVHAFGYYSRGCELSAPAGCRHAGLAYLNGSDGVQRDRDGGKALLQRACQGGDAEGCDALKRVQAEDDRAAAAQRAEAEAKDRVRQQGERQETLRHRAIVAKRVGAALLGSGVAELGLGALFIYLGSAQNDAVKHGGFSSGADIAAAADLGHTYNSAAAAMCVIGGLSVAGSIPLLILAKRWNRDSHVVVSAAASPAFAGIRIKGAF